MTAPKTILLSAFLMSSLASHLAVPGESLCGCDPKNLTSPAAFTTYLRFVPNGPLVAVVVKEVNGEAVLDEDVILGPAQHFRDRAQAVLKAGGVDAVNQPSASNLGILSAIGDATPWPDQTVPYEIDSSNKKLVNAFQTAVSHWEKELGRAITFRPRTPQDKRFMRVLAGKGDVCSWNQSKHELILVGSVNCARHEIGHALGLKHEHKRHDRAQFVDTLWENINKGHCEQFASLAPAASVGTYDLGSLMHYTSDAFTCNGKTTLQARPPGKITHRFDQITAGDVVGVRRAQGLK